VCVCVLLLVLSGGWRRAGGLPATVRAGRATNSDPATSAATSSEDARLSAAGTTTCRHVIAGDDDVISGLRLDAVRASIARRCRSQLLIAAIRRPSVVHRAAPPQEAERGSS